LWIKISSFKKKIIHRDLAARNVLIDKEKSGQLNAKLTDFGLSRQAENSIYYGNDNTKLPVRWCAPESIQRKKFSEKSDIHSLAIVFYEIISNGDLPFSDLKNMEVVVLVCDGGYPNKPSSCDNDIYELSKSIINTDPNKRPTLDEITSKLEKIDVQFEQTVFTNYFRLPNIYQTSVENGNDINAINLNFYDGMPKDDYQVAPSINNDYPKKTFIIAQKKSK